MFSSRMSGFPPASQSINMFPRLTGDSKLPLRCDCECVWLFLTVWACDRRAACPECTSPLPFSCWVSSSDPVTPNGNMAENTRMGGISPKPIWSFLPSGAHRSVWDLSGTTVVVLHSNPHVRLVLPTACLWDLPSDCCSETIPH